MIQQSASLRHALVRETLRRAGSRALIVYYGGTMPKCCEDRAEGEKIAARNPTETYLRYMASGHSEPPLLDGATYWRLMDNDGSVVMQGDGK